MSDSNMNDPKGVVVGTAGHIDHGKTSLVRALTGVDTDRLVEEKRRGISIDLGFAHFTLPDRREISFVDVPGHERFIKNMLAGAGGISAVLLVVAADESVKPQTREHFDICRLLGIERGLVALTKCDLATPAQINAARLDVSNLVAGSFLASSPVIPVSATTRAGFAELLQALAQLTKDSPAREKGGFMRLPLDRSFALKGFGTVVTGTLWAGSLNVGDTVELYPTKRKARVRGLQVHGRAVQSAGAGQRTAANLSGVDSRDVQRGDVLTYPGSLEATRLLQVVMDWLPDAEIPKPQEEFLLHFGTAEVTAHLKVLERHGKLPHFAQFSLSEPVLALPGDRFVLRRPSPSQTVAGGTVLDPFPPRRLRREKTMLRLQRLARSGTAERMEILVEEKENGRTLPELVRILGIKPEELQKLIAANKRLVLGSAGRVVNRAWIARKDAKLLQWLKTFHAKHPSALGAPIVEARLGLDSELATLIFEQSPLIRVAGSLVALADHKVQVSTEETAAAARLEQTFRKAGYAPPTTSEILAAAKTAARQERGLLEALIKGQKLVRISEDLLFHTDAIVQLRKTLSTRKGRKFTVPEFKEWMQISRKYAIPLLEYLDRQHVTRREGDNRIVL